jgi:diaminopimelate epimerase
MRNSLNNLDELTFPVVKMQGRGNDFVLVTACALAEALDGPLQATLAQKNFNIEVFLSGLARKVCDRRYSLGGDGLIIAVPLLPAGADEVCGLSGKLLQYVGNYQAHELALDFLCGAQQACVAWIYINADGSYSSICGNGLRCFAWFCKGQGYFAGRVLQVSTPTGLVELELAEDVPLGKLTSGLVTSYLTAPSGVAFLSLTDALDGYTPDIAAGGYQGCCVDMGNPHYVVFFPEEVFNPWWESLSGMSASTGGSNAFVQAFPVEVLCLSQKIQENRQHFPQGVNVEFACIDSQGQSGRREASVRVLVVERGCGPTLACASGACAVVVAGVKEKLFAGQCCVNLPGGSLEVGWSSEETSVKLTGWAQVVMDGALHLTKADLLIPVSEVAL